MVLQQGFTASMRIALAMRGMTQQDLANKIGKSPQFIHLMMKRNDAKYSSMVTIASALGMPVSEFIKLGE